MNHSRFTSTTLDVQLHVFRFPSGSSFKTCTRQRMVEIISPTMLITLLIGIVAQQ